MATTTPNYGWSVPTSSDLVKNGATDIETLGDSVDASLWSSGYGQAGKNKVINGDLGIWQRGTTFTSPASGVYTADRYATVQNGTGTSTISQQAFTLGTAPVTGYESTYFLRHLVTAVGTSTVNGIEQRIESVRTFANQTVTFSFWAKADAARTISARIDQFFGSGGSPSATVTGTVYTFSATTAWTRFSQTITLASIAGKTLGTNNNDAVYFKIYNANTLNSQMDLWGLQMEYGSKATPFQTASGGSQQDELAMAQRYYQRITPASAGASFSGFAATTSQALFSVPFAQTMRTAPTALEQTGTATDYAIRSTAGNTNSNNIPTFISASTDYMVIDGQVAAALTAGQGVLFRFNNAGVTYLGWSAEL